MRLIVPLLLLLFIAGGVVLGALNADLGGYDLAFARVQVPKGAAVLAIGWVLGGLTAWLGVTTRHRRERRHSAKAQGAKVPKTS
jgi:lipopolysaccharide assembly protein A